MQQFQNLEDDEIVLPRISFKTNVSLAWPRPSFSIESLSRKSFSYNKLPNEPLSLTILKLDGSSFVIVVPKMGTVEQLKERVEAAFSHLPRRGPGMVSWSHVWGHFCLCYDGQRLLRDTDYIGSYGISDGDTLHFVRLVSISCNLVKEEVEETSAFQELAVTPTVPISLSRSECCEEVITRDERVVENQQDNNDSKKDMGAVTYIRYRLGYLLGGCFACQKFTSLDGRMKQRTVP